MSNKRDVSHVLFALAVVGAAVLSAADKILQANQIQVVDNLGLCREG